MVILILLVILCIFLLSELLKILRQPPGVDRKLMMDEFIGMFKHTKYFKYQIDVDDIAKVEILGAITLRHTDGKSHIYTDKEKIRKIIDYFNKIPLAEAESSEVPNMSPDVEIRISNENDDFIGVIWIYGQVFIEDRLNEGQLYRSKYPRNGIIEGLENLEID